MAEKSIIVTYDKGLNNSTRVKIIAILDAANDEEIQTLIKKIKEYAKLGQKCT